MPTEEQKARYANALREKRKQKKEEDEKQQEKQQRTRILTAGRNRVYRSFETETTTAEESDVFVSWCTPTTKSASAATARTLQDQISDMVKSNQKQRNKEDDTDLALTHTIAKMVEGAARANEGAARSYEDAARSYGDGLKMISEASSNRNVRADMRADTDREEMHGLVACLTPHNTQDARQRPPPPCLRRCRRRG
jgi:hypothetical protein